uniref:Uncharacterized protein n=1 Tax=Anguilla anguilla TaxID=7936 RepID=A0A0E9Q4D9_ANGAN
MEVIGLGFKLDFSKSMLQGICE